MTERVRITMEDGVADVRLNRPEKLNGLDGPMFEALMRAGVDLAADARLRAAKRLLNEAYRGDHVEGLRREAREQAALLGSANQGEAVRANFEKRAPRFTDPE